jgi:hypothetical protein
LIENVGRIYALSIDRQKLFVSCEEVVVEGGSRGGRREDSPWPGKMFDVTIDREERLF